MFPVQFFLAASLALLFLTQQGHQDDVKSLLVDSTQQTPESSQSEKTDIAKEERIQAEVAEMMAIRKQFGGGVSEQLKDFSIEMPGRKRENEKAEAEVFSMEKAFAKKLAQQFRANVPVPVPVPAVRARINDDRWRLARSPQQPGVTPQERSETLRHAARMLEEAAAMLEEAREYDQADNIRQRAGELWRRARQ